MRCTMKRILHLSDFHINSEAKSPEDNEIITGLVKYLKSKSVDIDIVVYTGDLIDSKSIAKQISTLPNEEKAVAWNIEAKKCFKIAKKYLTYIKRELSVETKNIVVCCGNHDVNRNVVHSESINCDIVTNFTSKERFQEFDCFCNDMALVDCSSRTYFKTIDDFNFLVINTNLIDDKNKGLCVDCTSVLDVFEKNINSLKINVKNNKKSHNIFVAHSPQSDFCEFFKFGYSENNYKSNFDDIKKYFDCFFVGDKHSSNISGSEFIMGAPLSESQITYGIYEFPENAKMIYKKIRYIDGSWEIHESDDAMNEVLKESIPYLKNSGINFLYGFHNVDMEDAIKKYEESKSDSRWSDMDKLFKSYLTLQTPRIGKSGEEKPIQENIIQYTVDLINESDKIYPLVLRGMPKIGKSLFLTIVYMGMMSGYLNHTFNYIPLYFNLDTILKNITKKSENYNVAKTSIDNCLNKGKELSKKYNMPICYIFDGMRQHKVEDECVEDYLVENINSYVSFENIEPDNKIIFSVDTDEGIGGYNTKIHTFRKAAHILYFNPIKTNKIPNNEKFNAFISAFTRLYNCDDANIIVKNVKKLGFQYIDLNTLINFKEYFETPDGECCKTELYRELSEELIEEKNINYACQICYELYYKNQWCDYSSYTISDCKENVLYTIKKEVYLRNYLIAKYYVEEIKQLLKNPKTAKIDVVDECFGHEISSFICGILIKDSAKEIFKKFNEKFYKELSFKGKSMLSYLCGRLNFSNKVLNDILSNHKEAIESAEINVENEEQLFYKLVAQRSVMISSIIGLNDKDKAKKEFLSLLISNSDIRKVNRQFYLLYYGDRTTESVPFNHEIKEGFDFYNVYHILSSRLDAFNSGDHRKKLIEIELFTLCDLVQQRIDNPNACAWNNQTEGIPSIFYDEKHNKPKNKRSFNILTFMTKTIRNYLESEDTTEENELFKIYLHEKDKEFNAALCKIKDRALSVVERYNPALKLKECSTISKIEKIGWKIKDDISSLDKQLFDSYKSNKSYETVLEHIYECYLIGLFYLPADGKNENYNKQKILNMLLIHDLGECYCDDYPPFYNKINDIKNAEDIFNKGLYVNGVHEDISDLTEYLYLWKEWQNSSNNINIVIAKEIDTIHMIYKMMVLLKDSDIELEKERITRFFKEKKNIITEEGKKIYKILIKNNPEFESLIKELQSSD